MVTSPFDIDSHVIFETIWGSHAHGLNKENSDIDYRGFCVLPKSTASAIGSSEVKKNFYSLRPILTCQWLEKGMGPVLVEFDTMVQSLVTDTELKMS